MINVFYLFRNKGSNTALQKQNKIEHVGPKEVDEMGSMGIKTEHSGHKGSGRKSGFWGLRKEAKDNSRIRRRTIDKVEIKNGKESVTQLEE